MAGSGTSTYPIDHDDCSSSYHDHHNVLLFGPTKQWCDAFPLPLIGQSRSIFIGNSGLFGICFGGIMAKNAWVILDFHWFHLDLIYRSIDF
jgi:hypothetical protein